MKRIQIQNLHARNIAIQQKGFTLIESLVAMLLLLATLGGLIPVFMSYRLAAVDNQIKTGAIAVAQGELEDVRQTPFASLPVGTTPDTKTEVVQYMGKDYTKIRTFCPLSFDDEVNNANDIPSIHCTNDNTKKDVRVQVNYGNREILTVETVYTDFE